MGHALEKQIHTKAKLIAVKLLVLFHSKAILQMP